MNLRKGIFPLTLLLFGLATWLPAQETTVFTEANFSYKRGIELFNQGVYGPAQKEFQTTMRLLRPANEPEWQAIKTDAELHYAQAAVRLGQPEAEKLMLDFLRDNSPSPAASQAALEIGDYYFNAKQYDKALTYYDLAPTGSGSLRDEINFKKGYAYFVTKKFAQAKGALASVKERTGSEWYYPANYYYACCAFYEGKYDEASKHFMRVEKSEKYKQYVPYYIAQIYAAKRQYDQVISYAAPKAQDNNLKNRPELNQLVGQAYYEQGDYKRALPYLEFAATNGANLRPQDYYQLGYTQYQNGFYKQSIENFEQLTKGDSLLGQNGLYHLGDAYLRTGNKVAARNAFGQAANMNYDRTVKEDALINYAKLSYELNYDREALDALQRIPTTSRYYEDAQTLMSDLFLSTRDYDRAVATLESVKNRTPKLNETYQEVTFLRGLQLYQNNQKDEARRYFNKSLDQPINKRTAALSSFWLGAIANEKGEWDISRSHMTSFLNQAKSYTDLPEESSIYMGQYIQGYNLLKGKNYDGALSNFKAAIDGIERNVARINSDQIRSGVLGDAVLRAGDCHFKQKEYADAIRYYDKAINKKYEGYEYALYQKAIIKGLQGSPLDKALALEDLISRSPNGRYTDEALFQLGDTYQEMNRLDQAVPPLRRLVSDFKGRSDLINQALLKLGLISYNQGSTTTAINYYKQVFANNPENIEAKDALAALEEIYVKDLNRPDEYFAFVETVPGYKVSNSSRDSVTYQSAEIQFQNGRYQPAIDGFTNYLSKYPNGPNAIPAYYYRAESYAALKKYPQAQKDYATVVGRGPSRLYTKAAEKAAYLAFNEKDYPQTLEFARKWEESAGTPAARFDAQTLALSAAYETGNSVAVNEYANKVLNSPTASAGQQATANFYLGKSAYDKGNFSQAYPALEKVTTLSNQVIMAEAYHLMAQILYKQHKSNDAEALIGTANQASAGFDDWIARNVILLSDIYVERGDRNSAIASLEGLLENYNGDPTIVAEARKRYERLGGGNAPKTTPRSPGTGGSNLLELDGGN